MRRTTVAIDDTVEKDLVFLGQRTRKTESELVRRAIDHFLRLNADSGPLAEYIAAGLTNFPECQTPEDLAARLIVYWAQTTKQDGVKATLKRIETKIDAVFLREAQP